MADALPSSSWLLDAARLRSNVVPLSTGGIHSGLYPSVVPGVGAAVVAVPTVPSVSPAVSGEGEVVAAWSPFDPPHAASASAAPVKAKSVRRLMRCCPDMFGTVRRQGESQV